MSYYDSIVGDDFDGWDSSDAWDIIGGVANKVLDWKIGQDQPQQPYYTAYGGGYMPQTQAPPPSPYTSTVKQPMDFAKVAMWVSIAAGLVVIFGIFDRKKR